MRIRVRFFGALEHEMQGVAGKKTEIELPAQARIRDLLKHLHIDESKGIIASANGRILRDEDPLPSGTLISLFPPAFGG